MLHRVVAMRNPRLRYTVAPAAQRAAVCIEHLLPNAVLEAGMRKDYPATLGGQLWPREPTLPTRRLDSIIRWSARDRDDIILIKKG